MIRLASGLGSFALLILVTAVVVPAVDFLPPSSYAADESEEQQ